MEERGVQGQILSMLRKMTSELNPVRLRAENIDLRAQLEKVSAQVAGLQLQVSQQASRDDDWVQVSEYNQLEKDFQRSIDRETEYAQKIQSMNSASEKQDRRIKQLELEVTRAKMTNSRPSVTDDQVEKARKDATKEQEEEMTELRRQVSELKQREVELTDLVAELELSLQLSKESGSPKSDGSPGKRQPSAKFEEGELSDDQKAKLEEAIFAATLELEMKLEEKSNEVGKLKEQLDQGKQWKTERDLARNEAEKANAERNIALRVKEGALMECSSVRVELEKIKKEFKKVQVNGSSTSSDAMDELRHQLDQVRVEFQRTIEQHTLRFNEKDMEIGELSHQLQHTNEQLSNAESDAQNAWGQIEELKLQLATLKHEADNASQQRDLALAAGRQLDLMRQRAAEDREARHDEQIRRLHTMHNLKLAKQQSLRSPGSTGQSAEAGVGSDIGSSPESRRERNSSVHFAPLDQTTVKEIFGNVVHRYEELLQELHQAGDDEEQKEECMYDALFEYERRIWHVNNDLKSMRVIVDIRAKDMEQEMKRNIDAAETRVTLLRTQLEDLGATPNC